MMLHFPGNLSTRDQKFIGIIHHVINAVKKRERRQGELFSLHSIKYVDVLHLNSFVTLLKRTVLGDDLSAQYETSNERKQSCGSQQQ